MVGGFPCKSLFEFLQEVLLNFDSGDVTPPPLPCGDLTPVPTAGVRIWGAPPACSVDAAQSGVVPADGKCAAQEARLNVGAPRVRAVRARTGARIHAPSAYSPHEARWHVETAPACFPFDSEPHALALSMVWFQFDAPPYVTAWMASLPDEPEWNAPVLVCSREQPAGFREGSVWSPQNELPCSESLTPRGWKCDSRLEHSVHRPLSQPLAHAR